MNGVSTTLETAELPVIRPDVSHLVTEDDTPVDNIVSEKQMRLLTEPLYTSWKPGRKFLVAANVGVFLSIPEPPIVPDVFLSMDVEPHEEWTTKEHRSYFVWEFTKMPDVAIEVVSNREGGELTRKMEKYARFGFTYYAIFDPDQLIQTEPLVCYGLHEGMYVRMRVPSFRSIGLQLVMWEGEYEDCKLKWIRWADLQGNLLPTGAEHRARADALSQQTDALSRRADALAERLRQLGVDPDSV